MSMEEKREKRTDSPSSRSKKQTLDSVGSQYALQVALQTMKERCQQLQKRLAAEEEENLRLRMLSAKNLSSEENESDDDKIILRTPVRDATSSEEKVARLSRQNSQLRHHLFMVASENRQLWSRLSLLTEANQSLGNQLSKISLSLASQNYASKLPEPGKSYSVFATPSPEKDKSINQDKENMMHVQLSENKIELPSFVVSKSNGSEDPSLEEMSVKLIKNLLQEKIGLEQQYAEMVKMHSESSSFGIPNLDFGYFEDCDQSTVEQLRMHYGKLCEMKEMLKAQHDKLRVALENISLRKNGEALCRSVEKATMTGTPTEVTGEGEDKPAEIHKWDKDELMCPSGDIRQQLDQVAEPPDVEDTHPTAAQHEEVRVCPLCRQQYMPSSSFDDFVKHVYAHFQEGEDPVLTNFEIIPK